MTAAPPPSRSERLALPAELTGLAQRVRAHGGRLLVVGGFVRDAGLGRASRDLDLEAYDLPPDTLLDARGKPRIGHRIRGEKGLEL